MKKGNDTLEAVVILIGLFIIILIMPKVTPVITKSGPNSSNPLSNTKFSERSNKISSLPPAQSIFLGTGNASYAYQPYEEYITIDNRGRNPVDITNWQLKNGKDKRGYDFGGTLRYFPADIATIPQAALSISPKGSSILQRVVLKSDETAIVTTGSAGPRSPYLIVSFKENICSGFLEDLAEYAFTPPLKRNCPRPADEPGVKILDVECRRFIERMASCHMPTFDIKDAQGEICDNCVDGQLLSSACVAFIKNHFNYNSCMANHIYDRNFSGQTWRIFLGRGWELWAREYETMELFDQFGRLVDSRAY